MRGAAGDAGVRDFSVGADFGLLPGFHSVVFPAARGAGAGAGADFVFGFAFGEEPLPLTEFLILLIIFLNILQLQH